MLRLKIFSKFCKCSLIAQFEEALLDLDKLWVYLNTASFVFDQLVQQIFRHYLQILEAQLTKASAIAPAILK